MKKPTDWQRIGNWWVNFKHQFGHDFSQWSNPMEATRTYSFGSSKDVKIDVQTRVCQVCNYMESREISTS